LTTSPFFLPISSSMVRLVGLVALVAPVIGERVAVHNHDYEGSFEHLSTEDSAKANRGLHVLSLLQGDSSNVELQNEYRDIIGDVHWEESKVLLETGAKIDQAPVLLGQMSQSGSTLNLAELLQDSEDGDWVRLGRALTERRDYVVEQEGGESKYLIDGTTLSLHSRMHVSMPGDDTPRFVLRRAFNYLNPIARSIGQYVYRVIECGEYLGDGACSEGQILYTITKDRFGRGFLWGRDEFRVFLGTGGCSRHGYGVLSCTQSDQIMYSLSAGLSTGSYDTDYYKGDMRSLSHEGTPLANRFKVAHSEKTAGPPRWLHWPIGLAGPLAPVIGQVYNLARMLVWADAYILRLEGGGGAVDELLLSLMVSVQDLTRDQIASQSVLNTIAAANGASAGAAAAGTAAASAAEAAEIAAVLGRVEAAVLGAGGSAAEAASIVASTSETFAAAQASAAAAAR